MKKFLKKIAVYSLLIFIILNAIAYFSLYSLRKSSFYKPQFVENGVSEKKFDYLVLGSSTGLTTLNTIQIDKKNKLKGLNISLDDSSLSSHYLMLNHFYKLDKTTKCLVLAITPWDIENSKPKINENDYRFLPYISKDYVVNYYNEIKKSPFNILSLSQYFPILGVSYYNAELFFPSLLAFIKPEKRNRFDEKGNYSYPVSGGPRQTENKNVHLNYKNPYFFKIINFCNQNNIKLIVYQSPIYKTKIDVASHDFVLINHSEILQKAHLFYDNIHVNEKGREICSNLMSEELIKHKE